MQKGLPDELVPLLRQIEESDPSDHLSVANALAKYEAEHPISDAIRPILFAERFVFTLYPDRHGERTYWGCSFRPMYLELKGDGIVTSHNLGALTPEIFEYWTQRAAEAKHPILRARYADAAWEIPKVIDGVKQDIENARIAIDAYVAQASSSTNSLAIFDLRRALNLALSIHDERRVQHVAQAMFKFCSGTDPSHVGSSVSLFDSLFELRRKIKLSPRDQDQMITALEDSLRCVAESSGQSPINHSAAQQYGTRLIKYYRSSQQHEQVVRVTHLMARAIEKAAQAAEPIVAAAWLDDAYAAYAQAGLKDDAERVLLLLKQRGRESQERLSSHVITQSIPISEVEEFLRDVTSGGIVRCFDNIASFFLPKAANLRQRLKEIKEKFPLTAIMPIALLAEDQVIAHVGSVDNDEEGRLVYEIAQDMQYWAIFLMHALERMFLEHDLTGEAFVDLLFQTPLWGSDRYQILKNGMRHYREEDYIAAIHVLIPQLEHAMRSLLCALKRPTSIHNPKLDAFQEKDLGAILADDAIADLLGDDWCRYFRSLLTDQRGWNLRNRASHGLYGSHFFQRQIVDRIIHAMMLIACLRPAKGQTADGSSK